MIEQRIQTNPSPQGIRQPYKSLGSGSLAFALLLSVNLNGGKSAVTLEDTKDEMHISSFYSYFTWYHPDDRINLYIDGGAYLENTAKKNLQRVYEISLLEDNWDAEGASKFSKHLVELVRQIVLTVSKQPKIFPTAEESIQLEYENTKGDYLEFEVFENGDIREYLCRADNSEIEKNVDFLEINSIVGDFYAG